MSMSICICICLVVFVYLYLSICICIYILLICEILYLHILRAKTFVGFTLHDVVAIRLQMASVNPARLRISLQPNISCALNAVYSFSHVKQL